ncbi:MAG: N-acetyl-gamma-glutamyl-phosphate reductase [Geminicoccaceae bacterium]|nr:MAG: N-acetyl-gamma-glutamyl-phosphate reductase [Geminicoccaceae bacterium]
MTTTARIAVLGASGYTGAETIRLALGHGGLELAYLTADRQAGKPLAAVFPHLTEAGLPNLVKIDDVPFDQVDAVFCCLPHGTTQEVIRGLPAHLKVVDLSADFRLRDPALYQQWYGHAHAAPALQEEAVYGLTELHRDAVRNARLVANPGCYPTSAQLPLVPLLAAQAIERDGIVIDAKSGVTGAGRSLREDLLFTEVSDGFHAYGIGNHRHLPEIEQGLTDAAGEAIHVRFTPHLLPMNRGILATTYVRLGSGVRVADLAQILGEAYAGEPFVALRNGGKAPATREVRGTNRCLISVHADRIEGCAILVSVIDNLVKGAAGQAVQNLNLMLGFEETTGLQATATFP